MANDDVQIIHMTRLRPTQATQRLARRPCLNCFRLRLVVISYCVPMLNQQAVVDNRQQFSFSSFSETLSSHLFPLLPADSLEILSLDVKFLTFTMSFVLFDF